MYVAFIDTSLRVDIILPEHVAMNLNPLAARRIRMLEGEICNPFGARAQTTLDCELL